MEELTIKNRVRGFEGSRVQGFKGKKKRGRVTLKAGTENGLRIDGLKD
jgi:hypothetical protein